MYEKRHFEIQAERNIKCFQKQGHKQGGISLHSLLIRWLLLPTHFVFFQHFGLCSVISWLLSTNHCVML